MLRNLLILTLAIAPAAADSEFWKKLLGLKVEDGDPLEGAENRLEQPHASIQDCGRITADGKPNIIDGSPATHGELPWHAGVYRKSTESYKQICGGSLVSTTVVISAAHCFWQDGTNLQNAELFGVALGKIYRPWDSYYDAVYSQHFDVAALHVPRYFLSAFNNFQSDIAIVVLQTEAAYNNFVRPVCLHFDNTFKMVQLQAGVMGKMSGWGLTAPNGRYADVLQTVQLPYIPINQCLKEIPVQFQDFVIPNDKFCAGFLNGAAVCQGDSGGGLAFAANYSGVIRYILRGILSTTPRDDNKCTPNVRATFTDISFHEYLIKYFVNI